jgi:hypothetical protein
MRELAGVRHMARPFSPEGLSRHGFTIQQVKEWRETQYKAGSDSGLDDFYRAHGICVECGGHGRLVTGVRWRDEDGIERAEEDSVASLVQRHSLDNPKHWLTDALKWDSLYENCGSCHGLGH